jgi:hypothetical protein
MTGIAYYTSKGRREEGNLTLHMRNSFWYIPTEEIIGAFLEAITYCPILLKVVDN